VTRVFVLARSPVVRAGLERLLASKPSLQLAGSAAGFDALDSAPADVLLMEVDTAHEEPIPLGDLPPVVALGDGSPEWASEAVRSGIRAALPRDATEVEILAAIEAAAAGLVVVPLSAVDSVVRPAAPVTSQPLTAREIEVLRMIAEGLPNKTVGWRLGISEHTVKFHVTSIFSKLGASSRTEAVTIGLRHGLILI
jgi:two-component system, NarL family, response regulator YdfI